MEFSKKSTSVLMFPWLGHGHISPFLELAKKLSNRKFETYLCSTPANLVSVSPKIQSHSTNILLVELELPSLPNLPPKYHTTNGLPPNLMDTLKQAFDMSKSNFSKILKAFHPDLLIYDALQPWAQEEAAALDIPAVQFVTSSAVMTSMLFHAIYKPGNYFPFPNICFREYEGEHVIRLRKSVVDHLEGRNPMTKSIEKSKDIILLKGVKEIDEKYSDYLTSLIGKKVVNVGTLVNHPVNDDKDLEVMKWLDTRKSGSTVLVSFGSEYFLSKQEFDEIAHGLMLADKVNFIWVVRFPMGEKVKLEEVYPVGFYDKVGGRSMILHGWAPQAKILVHPSIGGFVSHCGWNSVVESMIFGVPIIAMPMHLDQPINARLVEDVGVGMEVRRNNKGMFERQEMARVIKEVMVEKEGEGVRLKAKELGERIRAKELKEPDDEFDQVVDELLKLKKSN